MTNNVTTNTTTNRAKVNRKRRNRRRFVSIVLLVIVIAIVSMSIVSMAHRYPDTVTKYHLMLELENGNEETMEYYKTTYIDEHIYLFNGDITLRLMAEQFNIDTDTLKTFYKSTGVESLQKLYDKYLDDEGIIKFLQDVQTA